MDALRLNLRAEKYPGWKIWSVRANTNDEQVNKKNVFSDSENDNEARQWRHQRWTVNSIFLLKWPADKKCPALLWKMQMYGKVDPDTDEKLSQRINQLMFKKKNADEEKIRKRVK